MSVDVAGTEAVRALAPALRVAASARVRLLDAVAVVRVVVEGTGLAAPVVRARPRRREAIARAADRALAPVNALVLARAHVPEAAKHGKYALPDCSIYSTLFTLIALSIFEVSAHWHLFTAIG